LDEDPFTKLVRTFFPGKCLQVQRCRALWRYANSDNPWGYVEARRALSERIAYAAEKAQLFLDQQQRLRGQIIAVYEHIPYAGNLDSIPGSPPVQNAVFLGILGDPKSYDDPRALVQMAGLNPGQRDSGEHHGPTRITKVGRTRLRRAAVTAAMTILTSRRNPDFVRRFFSLQQRDLNPLTACQALCACAGKYLRTAWWLCVRNTVYDSQIASQGFPWAKRPQSQHQQEELAIEIAH
jgi:hypothetical protein